MPFSSALTSICLGKHGKKRTDPKNRQKRVSPPKVNITSIIILLIALSGDVFFKAQAHPCSSLGLPDCVQSSWCVWLQMPENWFDLDWFLTEAGHWYTIYVMLFNIRINLRHNPDNPNIYILPHETTWKYYNARIQSTNLGRHRTHLDQLWREVRNLPQIAIPRPDALYDHLG